MPTKKYSGINKKYKTRKHLETSENLNNINSISSIEKIKNTRIEKYLKDIIEDFFPKSKVTFYTYSFKIKKDKYITFYIYDKRYKEGDFVEDFGCITLSFNHKKKILLIDELHKCILNGRKSLTNAIQIAYRLKYKYINLTDASTIHYLHSKSNKNCSMPLKIYNILLKGYSWYNKYGFYSDTHEIEQIEINRIRNTDFNMIIYEFCNYDDYEYNMIINSFNDYFDINIYKLTKNVFKDIEKIRKKLKTTNQKDNFYCSLSELVNLFKNNINYNYNLKLKVKK